MNNPCAFTPPTVNTYCSGGYVAANFSQYLFLKMSSVITDFGTLLKDLFIGEVGVPSLPLTLVSKELPSLITIICTVTIFMVVTNFLPEGSFSTPPTLPLLTLATLDTAATNVFATPGKVSTSMLSPMVPLLPEASTFPSPPRVVAFH